MAGWPVYLLIFLMPSPRLAIQTLAGYRMVTVQIAVLPRVTLLCRCWSHLHIVICTGRRAGSIPGHWTTCHRQGLFSECVWFPLWVLFARFAIRRFIHVLTTLCSIKWQRLWKWRVASAVHTDTACGASLGNSRAQHITGNMWCGVRSV